MQAGERRATEESGVAPKDQPHEILENGLVDRLGVEFQRDAIEPVDVSKRNSHRTAFVVDVE